MPKTHAQVLNKYFIVIFTVLTIIFSPSIAKAADYYVAPDGSGSACTLLSPCSLGTVNDITIAGTTIYLTGGTYDGTSLGVHEKMYALSPAATGTEANPIIYQPVTGETVTITNYDTGVRLIDRQWVTIRNIRFIEMGDAWVVATLGDGSHETPTSPQHITIENCYFSQTTERTSVGGLSFSGIIMQDGEYLTVRNNTFNKWGAIDPSSDDWGWWGDMIRFDSSKYALIEDNSFVGAQSGHSLIGAVQSSYIIIRNNDLHNQWEKDVDLDGALISSTWEGMYLLVENNKINDAQVSTCEGTTKGGTGFQSLMSNAIYRYNEVANNVRWGISLDTSSATYTGYPHNRIYNNTFVNNTYSGLRFSNTAETAADFTDNVVKNNIFYNNGSDEDGFYTTYSDGMVAGQPGAHIMIDLGRNYGVGDYTIVGNNFYQTTVGRSNIIAVNGANLGYQPMSYWQPTAGSYPYPDQITLNIETNPQFADYSNGDYTLSDGSSAIDASTALTTATSTVTNSTTLVVDDARYFTDGYTMIDGDWIKIGESDPVQIDSVDYDTNTIILTANRSWSVSDTVRLYQTTDGTVVLYGNDNDLGAYEYPSEDVDDEDDEDGDDTNGGDTGNSHKTFTKDTRCNWSKPPKPTWIKLTPKIENNVSGMLLTWAQYNADKVTIKIDNGTNTYPWTIYKTQNDGHEFLPNVQSWQNIKIRPINRCSNGQLSSGVSYATFPLGWYNN